MSKNNNQCKGKSLKRYRKALEDLFEKGITLEKLKSAHEKFLDIEIRDCIYEVVKRYINKKFKSNTHLTNGVLTFLYAWNQASFRYGTPNFSKFENFLKNKKNLIAKFRHLNLENVELNCSIKKDIINLFCACARALETTKEDNNNRTLRQPVATSKALFILASKFFPPWDNCIAKVYRVMWNSPNQKDNNEKSKEYRKIAEKYFKYITKIKELTENIKSSDYKKSLKTDRSLIKLIDEFNYIIFTKGELINKK